MALECRRQDCDGRITTGRRGRQIYWEGDPYDCPKCGAKYVIGITDDFPEERTAFLIEASAGRATPPKEGT